jgi:hypothetical protein
MSNLAVINGTVGGTLVVSGTSTLGGAVLCASNISSVNSTMSANCTVGGNVILSNNIYVSNGTIVISNASMGYLSGVSSSIQTQFSTLNSSTTALYGNVNLLQGYNTGFTSNISTLQTQSTALYGNVNLLQGLNTGFTSNISTLQTKTSRQSLDAVDNSTGFNGNLNVIGNVNITPFTNNTSLSIYNLRSNNLINTSTGLFSGLLTASNGLTVSSGTLTCGTLTNSGVHTASGVSNLAVTNTSGLLTASNGLTVSSGTLTCGTLTNSGVHTASGISNLGVTNTSGLLTVNNGMTIAGGILTVNSTSNMSSVNCGGINSGAINTGTSTLNVGGMTTLGSVIANNIYNSTSMTVNGTMFLNSQLQVLGTAVFAFINSVGLSNIGDLSSTTLSTVVSGSSTGYYTKFGCLATETYTFTEFGLYRVSMGVNRNPTTSGSYHVDVLNNINGGSRITTIFSGASMTISINPATTVLTIGCSASGAKLTIDKLMTY